MLGSNASDSEAGVVISHRMEDGTEGLITYASRTLASAERK